MYTIFLAKKNCVKSESRVVFKLQVYACRRRVGPERIPSRDVRTGHCTNTADLDAVDVGKVVIVRRRSLLEIDSVVHVFVAESHGLVDLDGLGELAV